MKRILALLIASYGLINSAQAYITLTGSLTNYTFRGDTTYYITGAHLYLYGTNNSFEGGAVIKYTNNAYISCVASPKIAASAYRPVIFTAKDDNSVGEAITGSTGNPTNYYAAYALALGANSNSLHNLRISFAQSAFYGVALNLTDAQINNCQNGVMVASAMVGMNFRNVLMANVLTNFNLINDNSGGGTISLQNVTVANPYVSPVNPYYLVGQGTNPPGYNMVMNNCIMANVQGLNNDHLSASYNGFYPVFWAYGSPSFSVSNWPTASPFQSMGAGNYYLTNGSPFRGVGTTNIDPALLADLRQKTTYPPIVLSNLTVTVNTNLLPQAHRDTGAAPDLGYHYDPIDYLVDNYAVNNATLTVINGTVLGSYNESGVQLQDGSGLVSVGTPMVPNWFVRYSSVQEQPKSLKGSPGGGVAVMPAYASVAPSGWYQYTKFACPAGGGIHLYDSGSSASYASNVVEDCEFWSGSNVLGGTVNSGVALDNNLFARSVINASGNGSLTFINNLVWGTAPVMLNPAGGNGYAFDNAFDLCTNLSGSLNNGYNAYLGCSGRLSSSSGGDIVQATGLVYQTGPFGTFYQPANSPLIYQGSTNAYLLGFPGGPLQDNYGIMVGLYDYTVTTNEIRDNTNLVSIGYHYPAFTGLHLFGSDTNGTPNPNDGSYPAGAMIFSGNTLYGTTTQGGSSGGGWPYYGGTLFAINTNGSGYTIIHNFSGSEQPGFNSDGAYPVGRLVLSGNILYGTTVYGGINGSGTVFKVNIDGTGFSTLHSFAATDGNGFNSDGANPSAGLVLSGSTLYGTAAWGGINGNGTVFKVNTNGTGFANLYTFTAGDAYDLVFLTGGGVTTPTTTIINSDGANPFGTLALSGQTLYGTTLTGGLNSYGTVFAINTNGTGFSNLHSFSGLDVNGFFPDGVYPFAGLLLSGSTLYGAAVGGGTNGGGTVFAINTNGAFTTICNLGGAGDVHGPFADLVLLGNTLYGTEGQNLNSEPGNLFAVNINGTDLANIYMFNYLYNDYYNPVNGVYSYGNLSYGGLVASGNTLYGTMAQDGGWSYGSAGAVFMLLPPAP